MPKPIKNSYKLSTSTGFTPRLLRSDPAIKLRELFTSGKLCGCQGLNTLSLKDHPIFNDCKMVLFAMNGSGLWRSLVAAYGKCDGMISNKYQRARIFSFETDNLYLLCTTETGVRGGTGWFFLEKSTSFCGPKKSTESHGYVFLGIGHENPYFDELAAFARDLLLDMAQAHRPFRALIKELRGALWVPLLSMEAREQADSIGACTAEAKTSRPRRHGFRL